MFSTVTLARLAGRSGRQLFALLLMSLISTSAQPTVLLAQEASGATEAFQAALDLLDGKPVETVDQARLLALRAALDEVVVAFPSSDLAVQILLGETIKGLDIGALDARLRSITAPEAATPLPNPAKPDVPTSPSSTEADPVAEPEGSVSQPKPTSEEAPAVSAEPPVSAGNDQMAACDALVGSYYNPDNPKGVPITKKWIIDAEAAMPVCTTAMQQHPDNLRMQYNYANAAYFSDDPAGKKIALDIIRRLSDLGYTAAAFDFAYSHYFGEPEAGIPKDPVLACKRMQDLADGGLSIAFYVLGYCYDNGEGVAKDQKRALEFYFSAAAAEQPDAEYTLGVYYDMGRGLRKDDEAAEYWLRRAVDHGMPYAAMELANFLQRRRAARPDVDAEMVRLYQTASEQGVTMSDLHLADIYSHGIGVPTDPEKAALLFLKILAGARAEVSLHVDGLTTASLAREAIKTISDWLSRDAIMVLQRQLVAAGAYQGKIDGVTGPGTRQAMWDYCRCWP